MLSYSVLDYIAEYLGYKAYELALILERSCLCDVLWCIDGGKERVMLKAPGWVRRSSLFRMATLYLYHGESAPQQQCYPDEAFAAAFAAMLSEPYLPNPEHDHPAAEHHAPQAPRPEDYFS